LICSPETPTTQIYPLSLHDALPIYLGPFRGGGPRVREAVAEVDVARQLTGLGHPEFDHLMDDPLSFFCQGDLRRSRVEGGHRIRSEEHTSELQSRENLVCRLLLEKK